MYKRQGYLAVVQCFLQKQKFWHCYRLPSSVKIECTNVRWYTIVTKVLWLRLKKEVVSMVIFNFENDFKYKSWNMEVMYGSPYRYLLPYSWRNGSMVMAKKIVFEIIADSDCTTLKTWKKSFFEKCLLVCLCVCLSVEFFYMEIFHFE